MLGRIKNIRKTKDPRKVINKAADLYEREPERWNQGEWIRTEDGLPYDEDQYRAANCNIDGICQVCLEGALLIFARDWDTYEEAKSLVVAELDENLPRRDDFDQTISWDEAYNWNDKEGRSTLEVVRVLRAAAKR